MSRFSKHPQRIFFIIAGVVAFLLTGLCFFRRNEIKPNVSHEHEQPTAGPDTAYKIPAPSDIFLLPDSSLIYVLDKVAINFARQKKRYKITMDGDFFYDIPERAGALVIHTRLLKLTVTGKAAFRVIAYNKDEGEEVQVLSGHIVAEKSYKSDFPEPEILGDDNLLMINKSIDLMEKEENLDTRELRKWKQGADSAKSRNYIRPSLN